MLNKILVIAAALGATTPALAQTNANFVGPRIELNAGLDDVQNARDYQDVNYGAAIGYDFPLSDRVTLGAEATAQNVFDSEGREFGAAARLGYAVSPNALLFGRVGYANVDLRGRNAEGLTVGGGLNFNLTHNAYASVEYRYTDFDHNVGRHGGLVGVGIRF